MIWRWCKLLECWYCGPWRIVVKGGLTYLWYLDNGWNGRLAVSIDEARIMASIMTPMLYSAQRAEQITTGRTAAWRDDDFRSQG